MNRFVNSFFKGLAYSTQGFTLIFKPALRHFVIIPFLINIGIFIGLFFISRHFFREFEQWFIHFLPHWLDWLSGFLWLLFFMSYFLIAVYTFITVANLISAPFNALLAEKVEIYLTGKEPEPQNTLQLIKDIPRVIGRQLKIIAYYLPRAAFLLILFFIPLVQTVAPLLWFLFSAQCMTLQYIDYPTDNHRIPLRMVQNWAHAEPGLVLGFGCGILFITMIPLLNCIVIPAAVASATQLWLEQKNRSSY